MNRAQDESDAKLAAEAKRGNRSAFAVLVRRTAARLMCVLRAMGLREEDAEDVMQDAYLRAWDRLDTYDARFRFSTWLFTIARRLGVSRQRAERPTVPLSEELSGGESRQPHGDGELWRRAASVLSVKQYEVMWLRYAEDMTPKEIAKATEMTESNVRVTLHRSRALLSETIPQAAAS